MHVLCISLSICHLSSVKGWPTFSSATALCAGEHGADRCTVRSFPASLFVCCWSLITDCEGTEHYEMPCRHWFLHKNSSLPDGRVLCSSSLAFNCTFPEIKKSSRVKLLLGEAARHANKHPPFFSPCSSGYHIIKWWTELQRFCVKSAAGWREEEIRAVTCHGRA